MASSKIPLLILRDHLRVVEQRNMDMWVSTEAIAVFLKSDRLTCGGQCEELNILASIFYEIVTMVFH